MLLSYMQNEFADLINKYSLLAYLHLVYSYLSQDRFSKYALPRSFTL